LFYAFAYFNDTKMHKKYLFEEIGKDIIHPRSGHEGSEGEQRYSCILALTSAPCPVCFTPEKGPNTHYRRWGVGTWPVWIGVENFAPTKI
jgi:hypothetical protein